MKLVIGQSYQTQYGNLRYMGLSNTAFVCEICRHLRKHTHELCANWSDYQQGAVGDWYHFGSECINKLEIS